MAELTGEEVVDAIVMNIRKSFTVSEITAIYQDKVLQHAKTPYAFIHPLNTEHTNEMRGYAKQDYLFDIRVHPSASLNVQTWARGIATKMVDAINHIQVSGQQVKSRSLTWNVQDEVLHILVSYQYRVVEVLTAQADMETINVKERIK